MEGLGFWVLDVGCRVEDFGQKGSYGFGCRLLFEALGTLRS